MMVALRIAKLGYYSGDPQKVLEANIVHVLNILEYESFNNEFEKVYTEINKGS